MKKIYKRVSFNIELAKKIQSGEVEGRIVTVDDEPIRVLALDINDSHPIAVAVTRPNSDEVVYTCKLTGKYIEGDINPAYDLAIELIEETLNYEFKIGDKVKVRGSNKILEILNIEGETATLKDINYNTDIRYAYRIDTLYHVKQEYEFKPFDRVLVRMCDEEAWRISLYGFKREDGTHNCVNTSCWEQCIPYVGNEHLLGTTNNPT